MNLTDKQKAHICDILFLEIEFLTIKVLDLDPKDRECLEKRR